MELDFGGGREAGLLGRPISRWTRSPLAWEDKVSVSEVFCLLAHISCSGKQEKKANLYDSKHPHLYDLRGLLRRAVT